MKNKHVCLFNKNNFTSEVVHKLKTEFVKLLLENKGDINIALSGGNTPLPILEELKNEELEWTRLNFFLVDERCVSLDNPESNYSNIEKIFFHRIPSKSYSMIYKNESYESSVKKYSNLLDAKLKKRNGIPVFDLILLGIGDDGHTASLFPNTKALSETKEMVVLNQVPQLDAYRITLTYPILLNAKKIFILCVGKEKETIIDSIYSNTPKNYPVLKIVKEFDQLIWLTA